MVSLTTVIMATEQRASLAESLWSRLWEESEAIGLPAPLVSSDRSLRGPRVGAARAWGLADLVETSHVLVIQEDAVPCSGFFRGVLAALEARPVSPVSFYTNERLRMPETPSFHLAAPFCGSVALAMPRLMAVAASRFLAEGRGKHDDASLSNFFAVAGRAVVTLPNLVQHSSAPSTVGHRSLRSVVALEPHEIAPTNWPH